MNVLAPFSMQQMCEDLNNAKYLSFMMETSEHKSMKFVPVLIRHLTPKNEIQINIIDFNNVKRRIS